MRRFIKIFVISIISVIIIFLGGVAFVLNFIFTPEKITPLVERIINDNINAHANIKKVDPTFFSTFPEFGLNIDSVVISNDNKTVPMASVSKITAIVNPIAFITSKDIIIKKVIIEKPYIELVIDSLGNSNLNILRSNTRKTVPADSSSAESNMGIMSINIDKIIVDSANITVKDERTGFYSSIRDMSLSLKGALSERKSDITINSSIGDLIVDDNGEKIISDVKLMLDADMRIDKDSGLYAVKKAVVGINNFMLGAGGRIITDTASKALDINIAMGLQTGSFSDLLKLMPESIVKKNSGFSADGNVLLNASINGIYSKESMPTLSASLNVEKAKVHYKGLKWAVDDISLNAEAFIDLKNKSRSKFSVKDFIFRSSGAGVSVTMNLFAYNIINNPRLKFDIKGEFNFDNITNVIPLNDNFSIKGNNTTNIKGELSLNDIKRRNYGRIILNGKSIFHDLTFSIIGTPEKENAGYLYASMKDGELLFGNKKGNTLEDGIGLGGELAFTGLGFKGVNGMELFSEDVNISLASLIQKDTTKITPIVAKLTLGGVKAEIADTLNSRLSKSELIISIKPRQDDPSFPIINTSLKTDSLTIAIHPSQTKSSISTAGFTVDITPPKTKGEEWDVNGTVGFKEFLMYTSLLPIDIKIASSALTFNKKRIGLKNTHLIVGESNMIATGYIDNMVDILLEKENNILYGNLVLKSNMINANEIFEAMAKSSVTATDNKVTNISKDTSTSEIHPFVVPKNVKLDLGIDAEKIKFGRFIIEDAIGDMKISDSKIKLSKFNIKAMDAQMKCYVVYDAPEINKISTGFNIGIENINISKLTEFMPVIDTLLPMIKSFQGIINFNIAAVAKMTRNMTPDINSLNALFSLKADSLVLMDSETFTKLSKILMFKNKQRNMIDSLNVTISANKGIVNVMPFNVNMDRYKAIVGGANNFSLDFNYNISIMKSPLPFKAGVDIFGNTENFDFKITKAKLKNTDFRKQQIQIDSIRNIINRQIGF